MKHFIGILRYSVKYSLGGEYLNNIQWENFLQPKHTAMAKKTFILLLIAASMLSAKAQEAEVAKYKAMFTLNFIRYIGWTDAAKQGDFVIGVYRSSLVYDNLAAQSAGKKFGYQNIVIKEFRNTDEITDCQIIYAAGNFTRQYEDIVPKLNGKNTLIITEDEGATKNGSMINFVVREGKLRFELHEGNANKYGLKFSSSLKSLSNAILK